MTIKNPTKTELEASLKASELAPLAKQVVGRLGKEAQDKTQDDKSPKK